MRKFLYGASTGPSFLPNVTRPFSLLEGGVWGQDYVDSSQTVLLEHQVLMAADLALLQHYTTA